jgi:hypothetical protein|tara:strand:+ start:232 stop:375 length:144 start_codon:yes stop_codon:yes gene_type:complete
MNVYDLTVLQNLIDRLNLEKNMTLLQFFALIKELNVSIEVQDSHFFC